MAGSDALQGFSPGRHVMPPSFFKRENCQGKAGGFVTGSAQRNGRSAGRGGAGSSRTGAASRGEVRPRIRLVRWLHTVFNRDSS
jgi:hypothetical protein